MKKIAAFKFVVIIGLLIITTPVWALSYYSFPYTVKNGDTFSTILKKFVKDSSIINAKTPMIKRIISKNPQVKKWGEMDEGVVLSLHISDDFIDMDKYKAYAKEMQPKKSEPKKPEAQKTESQNMAVNSQKNLLVDPTGLKGSLFYMASAGNFTQKSATVAEVNFEQNSPISLGASFSFYPKDKLYLFSSSAYYSYLMSPTNSLNVEKVKIPPEIGLNFYGEYRWKSQRATLFSGADFEKFTTFNLNGLKVDKKVYVDGVSALYWTFGITNSLTLFDKQFLSKVSVSKSIMTTYKNGAPATLMNSSDYDENEKYGGYKIMLYINYKFNEQIYFHSLLKYHAMTGPSDLTTLRVGVGVGYILF